MRILVVQNDPDKSLGRIADAMSSDPVELDVHMSDAGPPQLQGHDGLVVLPGLADPDDDVPEIHAGRRAIADALALGVPVLGICLGGQLLAQVTGGRTYRSEAERGYREVERTPDATGDPLFAHAPARLSVFHAHQYAFEPPPGATVLLANEVCVQAARIDGNWAVQCHPETTLEFALGLARRLRGEESIVLERTAAFFRRGGLDPDALEADARAADATARDLAHAIAKGFLARCAERAVTA
jgi:GMP synthase (glutamine-hydrolysing)